MVIPLVDSILCDIFLDRVRPSKKLQADIHEFDRMQEDDPRSKLTWFTESID